MHESDAWRIAIWAVDYDALPFLWVQPFGVQPVLMSNEVYRWRTVAATPTRKERKRRGSRRRVG